MSLRSIKRSSACALRTRPHGSRFWKAFRPATAPTPPSRCSARRFRARTVARGSDNYRDPMPDESFRRLPLGSAVDQSQYPNTGSDFFFGQLVARCFEQLSLPCNDLLNCVSAGRRDIHETRPLVGWVGAQLQYALVDTGIDASLHELPAEDQLLRDPRNRLRLGASEQFKHGPGPNRKACALVESASCSAIEHSHESHQFAQPRLNNSLFDHSPIMAPRLSKSKEMWHLRCHD